MYTQRRWSFFDQGLAFIPAQKGTGELTSKDAVILGTANVPIAKDSNPGYTEP